MANKLNFILLILLLPAVGCGRRSGIERVYVSGSASYRGAPIEIGQIRFIPISPSTGPVTIERVRGGRYETSTSGGVPPGTHRVEIRMYNAEEYENAPRTPGTPSVKQLLPDKYNRESELTFSIESGIGEIEHDFDLAK